MINFNDLKAQQKGIITNINKSIKSVLNHGKYIMGPEVYELEKKLAKYIGVKYCISLSSGTDALLTALMSLGVKRGDEVITTPFSYFATSEVILLLGAKPIYVDVELNTFNIDPNKIEQKISNKTKVILPVSIFGQCANFNKILKIGKKYKIPIIEDAAQSFGAEHFGKKSCNFGKIGCTSFFPSKPLGGYGDGGACFTNDLKIANTLRKLRVHGQIKQNMHSLIGFNARLDTLQAAILLEKLKILPKEIILRKKIANNYNKLIAGNFNNIIIPFIGDFNNSVYAQYTIRTKNRKKIISNFKKNNIPYAIYYKLPAYKQKIFTGKKNILPNVEILSKEVLSLPMHPYLSFKDQEKIVNLLAV